MLKDHACRQKSSWTDFVWAQQQFEETWTRVWGESSNLTDIGTILPGPFSDERCHHKKANSAPMQKEITPIKLAGKEARIQNLPTCHKYKTFAAQIPDMA